MFSIITVDRIEGDYAVCIDGNNDIISIPLSFFKEEVKEGFSYELCLKRREDAEEKSRNDILRLFGRK